MKVLSINEEDLSDKDDPENGFIQADFSLIVDLEPDDEHEYAMATLYYFLDRTENIVVTEVSFAFE